MQVDRNSKPSASNLGKYGRTCPLSVGNWKDYKNRINADQKEEIVEAAGNTYQVSKDILTRANHSRKLARLESIKIKGRFDYNSIQSLSTEARQKLVKIDPKQSRKQAEFGSLSKATSTCCWCFRDDKRQRFT